MVLSHSNLAFALLLRSAFSVLRSCFEIHSPSTHHLTRGAVSPFGLINDVENNVVVFMDEELSKASLLGFHPNRNDATLTLSFDDLMRFFEWTGNETRLVSL